MVGRQKGCRGAAWNKSLQGLLGAHPSCMLIDEFTKGDPHRHFIVPRPLHMSADTEDACTGALRRRSYGCEPFGAPMDDVWKVRERFHIVDDCRLVIQTRSGRKRWLDPWQPALAF